MASTPPDIGENPPVMREDILARGRRNVFALLLQKLTTPVVSFAITVLLARGLSRQEYGAYGLLQGMLPYFALATGLGLAYGFMRFLPDYHDTGRDGLARRFVRIGILARLLACLVAFGLALLFSGPLLALFGVAGYETAFKIFTLSSILMLEAVLASLALNSLFLTIYAVIGQIVYTVLKAALLLGLVSLHRLTAHAGLYGAVRAAVPVCLCGGVSDWYAKGRAGVTRSWPERRERRRHV
jgi:hypothetical protein